MIDSVSECGCRFVKFQKRNPDICVPEHQKNVIKKDTPWGKITYLDYRKKLELNIDQYKEIDIYCKNKNIKWFASVWDIDSAKAMKDLMSIVKIPSAKLTDDTLLEYCRDNYETLLMSTGMSSENEIEHAIEIGNPDVIFACNSEYPTPLSSLNLSYIKWLINKYPNKEIGFSSHDLSAVSPVIAVTYGSKWIERHFTIDKNLWGSDQKVSIDANDLKVLINSISETEEILRYGDIKPREITAGEMEKLKSLRGL